MIWDEGQFISVSETSPHSAHAADAVVMAATAMTLLARVMGLFMVFSCW